MGKIVVVTTGGTIASLPDGKTGLYTSGAMDAKDLIRETHVESSFDVLTEDLFHVSSNAMNFELLNRLKEKIYEILKHDDVLGVVVTHGTDTLEETAYFLSLCIKDERPVVITGSQRTPQEQGTDAFSNLRDAIVAAASPSCRGLGVIVQFNEGLFSARYVRKIHSFNTNAFASFGFGMLGHVDGDRVHIAQTPVGHETYDCSRQIPRVDIIKAYVGCDGALIKAAADAGARGIILEGFGRGHFPPDSCGAISAAAAAGVILVITTTCEMGGVFPVYNMIGSVHDLSRRGVISGFDYAARKARIKLSVLLASGVTAREDIQKAFSR